MNAALQGTTERSDEFRLQDFWMLLRRRRWLVLGCAALGLAGGVGALHYLTPTYEAFTTIRVDEASVGLPELGMVGGLGGGNQIGTDMEVLRSRMLAQAVVDSLDLQVEVLEPVGAAHSQIVEEARVGPEADTARILLVREGTGFVAEYAGSGERIGTVPAGGVLRLPGAEVQLAAQARQYDEIEIRLRSQEASIAAVRSMTEIVRPSRDANIVQVRAHGSNAQLVRDVPNVLAARFVAHRQSAQKAQARSTAEFLRSQIDTLALQLATAEDQLRNFREGGQIVDLQVEGSTQVRRLAEMEASREALEAERSALASLVEEVRTAAALSADPTSASPYRRLLAFPSLMRNQTAAELLRSLTALEDERSDLMVRRSALDPDVQVRTTRIRELERQLQAIVTTYLEGLSRQVASLDRTLVGFQAELETIPGKELQFARLSRQPKVLEEMYALLQTRLKEAEVATAVEDPSLRIVDQAVLPTRPVSPQRPLVLSVALLMGLLAGVGGGFLREYLDASVRTRGDAMVATGLPVLGLVPRMSQGGLGSALRTRIGGGNRPQLAAPRANGSSSTAVVNRTAQVSRVDALSGLLISQAGAPSQLTDIYDRLHTNILFSKPDAEFRTLLVTSALPGDGKTTNAVSLAITLAQRGLKVLLIDADLRRGSVSTRLGLERTPGLSEVLSGTAATQDAVRPVDVGNGATLHVLSSGNFPANPAQMLGSERMEALLERLASGFDKVIIDSPPLNVVVDAAVLGHLVDGVVLIARTGVTPYEALVYAAEQFRNAQLPMVGVVLNDIDFKKEAAYDRAYQWYGYGESYYSSTSS